MTGSSDPAVIQAEIEATRARLGRTVDEIGARLDVRRGRAAWALAAVVGGMWIFELTRFSIL